ncbi:MAG TPA: GntR family transcriptional regulator [Candidatus Corynebacterium avicola]|uniref:GntR family transcriptional regulator n=1 Tax=Candidatus Corynebacterium avicola TaxID=2838527 RepID=A0A9D1RPG9_9CORY|nr:GntR family transcriptional regulator [Candidatus Corynebacterium avicola]
MPLTRLDTAARVGDQAFEALQHAITTGELEAGDRLQIRDLADRLGISVMPVREAIKRLEEIGLVETRPYRGAVVKGFTPAELLNIYSVRRLLETDAARLGAVSATETDVDTLNQLFSSMEDALDDGDVVAYLDLDEEILGTVYACANNPVLEESIRSLWVRCRHYKIAGARKSLADGSSASLLTYQRAIINAVADGDGTAAAAVTGESLDAAMERIRSTLSD